MTSTLTRVVSVHFDERPHEWRSVHDPRGYPQLVTDVLTPPQVDGRRWVHGHRMIIVGDHPYDPASRAMTPMLLVAVGNVHDVIMGAVYYRSIDDDGTVAGWVTVNPQPIPGAPEFAFSSQGWNSFPVDAVVDESLLRALVAEYLETGHQPKCVPWHASEYVQ